MAEDTSPPQGQDQPFKSAFPADVPDDGGLDAPAIPLEEVNKLRGTLDITPDSPGTPGPDAVVSEDPKAAWVKQKASEIQSRMNPDVSAEQWWEQPHGAAQVEANNVADDDLDVPAVPREHLDKLRGTLITSADVPKGPSAVEQQVNSEGIEVAKKRLNEFFAQRSVEEFLNGYTARVHEGSQGNKDVVTARKTAINHAIELAKGGELQQVQLLWGIASGDHSMEDNARYALEHVSHDLMGYDGNFHVLTDMGRARHTEKAVIMNEGSLAYSDALMRAMAIAQNHPIELEYAQGGRNGFLAPILGPDGKQPTGLWVHIDSGAFAKDKRYNPMAGEIWNVNIVIPPYGKPPEFTDDMRQAAKERAKRPLIDFAREVKLPANDAGFDESWIRKIEQDTEKKAETLMQSPNNYIPKSLKGMRAEDGSMQPAEQIVKDGAFIQAGAEMFKVNKDHAGKVTLDNDSLWSDIHAIGRNLDAELPHTEMKEFRDEVNQWIRDFISRPLEVGTPVVVGRDPDGPNIKGDMLLSRQHFSVELLEDGSIRILDLGSSNGTNVFAKKENLPPELPPPPPSVSEAAVLTPETPVVKPKSKNRRFTTLLQRNK